MIISSLPVAQTTNLRLILNSFFHVQMTDVSPQLLLIILFHSCNYLSSNTYQTAFSSFLPSVFPFIHSSIRNTIMTFANIQALCWGCGSRDENSQPGFCSHGDDTRPIFNLKIQIWSCHSLFQHFFSRLSSFRAMSQLLHWHGMVCVSHCPFPLREISITAGHRATQKTRIVFQTSMQPGRVPTWLSLGRWTVRLLKPQT